MSGIKGSVYVKHQTVTLKSYSCIDKGSSSVNEKHVGQLRGGMELLIQKCYLAGRISRLGPETSNSGSDYGTKGCFATATRVRALS